MLISSWYLQIVTPLLFFTRFLMVLRKKKRFLLSQLCICAYKLCLLWDLMSSTEKSHTFKYWVLTDESQMSSCF